MTGMEYAAEQVARAIYDAMHRATDPYSVPLERAAEKAARALADAGLLAPAPLTEEWAARYVNGGGAICRTRDEAEAELDRMTRDSRRHRVDEPPAPKIAGIYVRCVTDWEEA